MLDYIRVYIYWGSDQPAITFVGYDSRNKVLFNRQYKRASLPSVCRIMRTCHKRYAASHQNEFSIIEFYP